MSAMQRPDGEDEQPLREVKMKAGDILRFKEDRSGLSKEPATQSGKGREEIPKQSVLLSQMSELVSYSVLFEITYYNWP